MRNHTRLFLTIACLNLVCFGCSPDGAPQSTNRLQAGDVDQKKSAPRDRQVEAPRDSKDLTFEWSSSPPEVIGSERFSQQVRTALDLILSHSPESYSLIQRYVGAIKQGERSGMWAFSNPPVFEMADPTTFASVTWCAGSIAHDALHSKQYHDFKATHGAPVPSEVWTGKKSELACIAFQLEVLEKIGAPERELEHLKQLDGRHYDVNGDGKYSMEDYWQRDW